MGEKFPRNFRPKARGGIQPFTVCNVCEINKPGSHSWIMRYANSPECPEGSLLYLANEVKIITNDKKQKHFANNYLAYHITEELREILSTAERAGCTKSNRYQRTLQEFLKNLNNLGLPENQLNELIRNLKTLGISIIGTSKRG